MPRMATVSCVVRQMEGRPMRNVGARMSDNRGPSWESSRAVLRLVRRARRSVLVSSVVGLRRTFLLGQYGRRIWGRHHRLIHVHDHIEVLGAVHPEWTLSEY